MKWPEERRRLPELKAEEKMKEVDPIQRPTPLKRKKEKTDNTTMLLVGGLMLAVLFYSQ